MKSPYAYTLDHLKLIVAVSGIISMWTIFFLRPTQIVHVEVETKSPLSAPAPVPVAPPHELPPESSKKILTKRPSP